MSDLISKADSEFKQGNFEIASQLYDEALSLRENENASAPEIAEILQKLADAAYAANKYEQARASYARLVELHIELGEFSGKDRVSVLLKLAKCSEKSGQAQLAETEFESAYELAQAALSAKHYLMRSVAEGYADCLRATGRNSARLADLEQLLGIEQKEEQSASTAFEEVTPDTVKVSLPVSKPAGEQEHFVLKKKLTKVTRKSIAAKSAAEPGEEGSKPPEVVDPLTQRKEKGKPTIDQQVAERKFLRRTEELSAPEQRTSQRAKLRNVLSDETKTGEHRPIEVPADPAAGAAFSEAAFSPAALAAEEPQNWTATRYGAESEMNGSAARSNQSNHFDQPQSPGYGSELPSDRPQSQSQQREALYSPPQTLDPLIFEEVRGGFDPSMTRLLGKPRRHMSDTMELNSSRKKKGVNLVVPNEAAKMAETSRQFLQHAEAVKKATDPASESAADLDQLRSEEPITPKLSAGQRAAWLMKFVSPALAIVLLGGAAFFLFKEISMHRAPVVPVYAAKVVDQVFATADNSVIISPSSKDAIIRGAGLRRVADIHFWNDDPGDEFKFLFGGYKGARLLQVVPEGLKDEQNGVILYAPDAPERKVARFMEAMAEDAQRYYSINNDYPSYTTNLTEKSYLNPFTGRAEEAFVFSGVNQHLSADHESELDTSLRAGTLYSSETAIHPGAIHAISLIGNPVQSPEGSGYIWQVHCFYIRACGRDGKFLGSGQKDKTFVLTMKNGMAPLPPPVASDDYGSGGIIVCEAAAPDATMILLKYLGGFLVSAVLIWLLFRYTSAVRR